MYTYVTNLLKVDSYFTQDDIKSNQILTFLKTFVF